MLTGWQIQCRGCKNVTPYFTDEKTEDQKPVVAQPMADDGAA